MLHVLITCNLQKIILVLIPFFEFDGATIVMALCIFDPAFIILCHFMTYALDRYTLQNGA